LQGEEEFGAEHDEHISLPAQQDPAEVVGRVVSDDSGDQRGGQPETRSGGDPEVGGAAIVTGIGAVPEQDPDDELHDHDSGYPPQGWGTTVVAAGGLQGVQQQR